MLSLYNIYKSIILESTEINAIMDAINNHYTVNIMYDNGRDDGTKNLKRYCQVYNYGTTKLGNPAIRVFQVSGLNVKTNRYGIENRWKTLRVDRILSWEPTKFKIYKPIKNVPKSPDFNPNHDITLNNGSLSLAKF